MTYPALSACAWLPMRILQCDAHPSFNMYPCESCHLDTWLWVLMMYDAYPRLISFLQVHCTFCCMFACQSFRRFCFATRGKSSWFNTRIRTITQPCDNVATNSQLFFPLRLVSIARQHVNSQTLSCIIRFLRCARTCPLRLFRRFPR